MSDTFGSGDLGGFGVGDSDFGFDVAALEDSLRREAERVRADIENNLNINLSTEALDWLELYKKGFPQVYFDLNQEEEGPADIVADPVPNLEDYVTGIVIQGTPGFVPGVARFCPS